MATPIVVGVTAGQGLVGRFGDVIVFAGVDNERVGELLECAKGAAALPDPGTALLSRLAPVTGAAGDVPFGVVAPTADGLLIILRGPMNADVVVAGSGFRLSGSWPGSAGSPWLSQYVPAETSMLTVSLRGQPGSRPSPHADLVAGVVPGAGFVRRRITPVENPVESEKTVAHARADSAPTVLGDVGAPTSKVTRSLAAASSSAPMETSAVASSVGVLASADGSYFPLDRAYVIGRAPMTDEAIQSASASPIVVPYDPYVSRVHAYLSVEGDAVYLRDAGTSEGTFVAPLGAAEWTRVGADPALLPPGWSMRVGNWIAVHQAGIAR